MRRPITTLTTTLTTITTTIATAAALAIAAPAPAHATDHATDHALDHATDRMVTDHVEVLRLECAVRATDRGPAIGCRWSEPTSPPAVAVRLYRLDPAVDDHRRVVYRSTELGVTTFTDVAVRPGHRYAYAIVAVDEAGRTVARSRAEWVRVPSDRDVELLRLACRLGPAHEAVGCEWTRPTSRDAFVVSLWRSVDGGPRELVERFRPSGPTAYRDPVPGDAASLTYAVIATAEDGTIVARSRPETVRIPVVGVAEVDAAPSAAGSAGR